MDRMAKAREARWSMQARKNAYKGAITRAMGFREEVPITLPRVRFLEPKDACLLEHALCPN